MAEKQKLVIIGNGMVPGRMLEYLFDQVPDAFEVSIFNAEPRVNYNRLMLSFVLCGEKSYQDIITHDDHWYAKHGITLYKSSTVTEIDPVSRTVTSENGITQAYNKLVIATGSRPIMVSLPGHDLEGVLTYRDLDDVQCMLEYARTKKKAVVIGGGLLGLEAAAGLKTQAMDVTVVHLADTLMEKQLDETAGHLLADAFKNLNVDVLTGANTSRILGSDGKVVGIELEDGRQIASDLVCMAVGIQPNIGLARSIGLDVNRGILVGDDMTTSMSDIFALGECVEHNGQCYGLVAPLYEMAKVLADNLLGKHTVYAGSVTAAQLKVTGIDLYSAGDFAHDEDREEIVLHDRISDIYKRLILKDNRIIGVILYGETGDGPWFFDLLKKKTDISEMRDMLIFGQAYQGGSSLESDVGAAALPETVKACDCNGIGKDKTADCSVKPDGGIILSEVRALT